MENFSAVDRAEQKTRLQGKFQPGLKLDVIVGTVYIYIYLLLYIGVVRMRLTLRLHGEIFRPVSAN